MLLALSGDQASEETPSEEIFERINPRPAVLRFGMWCRHQSQDWVIGQVWLVPTCSRPGAGTTAARAGEQ